MTIGVVCARVRVEEKQILGAFGDHAAMPMLPASTPLPPGPASVIATEAGAEFLDIRDESLSAVVDRCANRSVAQVVIPLLRARGVTVFDAGVAATGSRLQVASALETAGVARPSTLLAFDEDSANLAARRIGVPASLFALTPGTQSTPMIDLDTADAVIEHRMVLAASQDSVVLVQAGAPVADELSTIHVVHGKAIAWDGAEPSDQALALAVIAANALQAQIASVQIAFVSGQLVVWDVVPVADFRHATNIGSQSVARAIAEAITGTNGAPLRDTVEVHGGTTHNN